MKLHRLPTPHTHLSEMKDQNMNPPHRMPAEAAGRRRTPGSSGPVGDSIRPRFSATFAGILVALVVLLAGSSLAAQSTTTGIVEGRVLNSVTGSYLGNARISIEGSALATTTDVNGAYRLVALPKGEVRVRASYVGMEPKSAVAVVSPGETTTLDFELVRTGEIVVMSELTVIASREMNAQTLALNEQRNAPNIKNVVAFDEYNYHGQGNVGDLLKFIPGMSVVYSGNVASSIAVRGMPAYTTNMLMDGAPLGSGKISPSRTALAYGVPMSNVSRVEVNKVPTPDMPASGMGSSINIITKSGFERTRPLFTYNVYGLLRTDLPVTLQEVDVGTPSPHVANIRRIMPSFDVAYMHPISNKLAISVSASNILNYSQGDVIYPRWNEDSLIQTSSGVRASPGVQATRDGRVGVEWKLDNRNEFSASLLYRRRGSADGVSTISANYGAGATGDRTSTQGASTAVGSLSQAFSWNQFDMDTTHGVFKYKHRGDRWKIDGQLSNSRSRTQYGSEGYPYFSSVSAAISNLIIKGSGIGSGDEKYDLVPSAYTITERAGNPVDGNNGNNYTITAASTASIETEETRSEARFDLGRSFSARIPISIKFGASILKDTFEIANYARTFAFRPTGTAADRLAGNNALVNPALHLDQGTLFGGRPVQWVSPLKVYDLFMTSPGYFVLNDLTTYRNRVNNSKELTETITAGYLRGDVKLLENRLLLVGGVRFERTADDGMGPLSDATAKYVRNASGKLVLDGTGKPVPITTDALQAERLILREREARTKRNYDGLFPSLNATYEISERLLARFGFASTIGRPDLGLVIPGITVSEPGTTSQGTVTVVNTGLKPWTANNYDLSLESYFLKGGFGTISVFQKDIKDFFTVVRTAATPELLGLYGVPSSESYLNYDIVTRGNGGDAKIKGFEFSYKQALTFLPSWASGVQVFFNYTKNSLSGSTTADFAQFNPKVMSWGASLVRPRYILKFTMAQQAETRRSASSVVGRSNYQGAIDRDTIAGEYQVTKRLSIYAQISDLLAGGYKDKFLIYDPSKNTPSHVRLDRMIDHGIALTVGIKGQF
jgi:iron complex outermembrane receptor protein